MVWPVVRHCGGPWRGTVQIIALAAQYIDDNPLTSPVLGGTPALEAYHFIMPRLENPGSPLSIYLNPQAEQLDRLYDAAMLFDRACPANGQPAGKVKAQLYGEYLHAYADTYAHRDENNNPYGVWSLKGGYGHLFDIAFADRTYNFYTEAENPLTGDIERRDWYYQEARTLEVEKQIFYKLREDFRTEIEAERTRSGKTLIGTYKDETDALWYQIAGDGNADVGVNGQPTYQAGAGQAGTMQEFNKEKDEKRKVKLLTDWLDANGKSSYLTYSTEYSQNIIPIYDGNPQNGDLKSVARDNRDKYLEGYEPGDPDMPGVLLPIPQTQPAPFPF